MEALLAVALGLILIGLLIWGLASAEEEGGADLAKQVDEQEKKKPARKPTVLGKRTQK